MLIVQNFGFHTICVHNYPLSLFDAFANRIRMLIHSCHLFAFANRIQMKIVFGFANQNQSWNNYS